MKLTDSLKQAQTNLMRSKLRTLLTVTAVFIGALTISLTNGVGSGVNAYIDEQLGSLGAENTLIIMAQQETTAPGMPTSGEIQEFNPDQTTGAFNMATLNNQDRERLEQIDGISEVTPNLFLNIDYVTRGGENDKKLVFTPSQFIDGLNIQMDAGRVVERLSDNEATLPNAYLEPLGFDSAEDALDQTVMIGFTDVQGVSHQVEAKIVGVQKNTIMGGGTWYLSDPLTMEIHQTINAGVESLLNNYLGFTAQFDPELTPEEVDQLKATIAEAGPYEAMTVQDQIGIISTVIDSIIIALNIFGAIALLAASFGIVNTLLMAVNERTREIGLMKALGANNRTIFGIFSIEAISLGFWGALLGVLVSMGIGAIANPIASETFLKDLEGFELLAFPLGSSLTIIAIIMVIAFIAGALPSLKASRLNPIEALRYE